MACHFSIATLSWRSIYWSRSNFLKSTRIVAVITVSCIIRRSTSCGVILDGNRTGGWRTEIPNMIVLISSLGISKSVCTIVIGGTVVVLVRVVCGTFVSHIGVVTCLPVCVVGDDLCSSIRKGDSVFSSHLVAVAGFLTVVIVAGVVVFYLVSKFVGLRLRQCKTA